MSKAHVRVLKGALKHIARTLKEGNEADKAMHICYAIRRHVCYKDYGTNNERRAKERLAADELKDYIMKKLQPHSSVEELLEDKGRVSSYAFEEMTKKEVKLMQRYRRKWMRKLIRKFK